MLIGTMLRVEVVIGPKTQRLAPIFSVFDEHQREIFLVGAEGDDLVVRYRLRAAILRLDQPGLRLVDGLRDLGVGDTTTVAVRRTGSGFHLSTGGGLQSHAGFTIGAGWTFLMFPERLPAAVVEFLNAIWVALLTVPLGFWGRQTWLTVLAASIILATLVATPAVTRLMPTPGVQLAAALGGVFLGVAFRLRCRTWGAGSSDEARFRRRVQNRAVSHS